MSLCVTTSSDEKINFLTIQFTCFVIGIMHKLQVQKHLYFPPITCILKAITDFIYLNSRKICAWRLIFVAMAKIIFGPHQYYALCICVYLSTWANRWWWWKFLYWKKTTIVFGQIIFPNLLLSTCLSSAQYSKFWLPFTRNN